MDSYQYLFPFEMVKSGSDIIIYGAGVMGQEYLRQMMITEYCNVVALIDRNYENYFEMKIPVVPPTAIHDLAFDYVVIALQKADALKEIIKNIHSEGVEDEKIVYVLLRDTDGIELFAETAAETMDYIPAYESGSHSAAVSVTGGIGDMVIQKRFISELVAEDPELLIDFYAVDTDEFLKFLYSDCKNINVILPNLGMRYEQSMKKYDLSIFIEGTAFVRIDHYEAMESLLDKKIKSLKEYIKKENANMNTPMCALTGRRIYEGRNCYTWFSFDGIFPIEDDTVEIPMSEDAKNWFDRTSFHGRKYITVNYGNGKSDDGMLVSKAWPVEHFGRLTGLIHESLPDMLIIQLGTADCAGIEGVDYRVMGERFDRVACILSDSMLHIDIDGGLVHLASQLGTKCVVLFGPTPVEIYGYDQNINIVSDMCKGCFGLYNNGFECARHMEKPECMYSISPERVASAAVEYLEGVV